MAGLFLGAGQFLTVPSHEPAKADLVVVLGGESGNRSVRAGQLFAGGFAPKVLITGQNNGDVRTRAAFLHWRAQYLVDAGVPQSALLFDHVSASSWQEAINTLQLMRDHGMNRVLVVSDPPHLRRLGWTWSKVFAGSGKEFRLIAAPLEWWDASRWWVSSASAQYVFGEYIKLAYYIAEY